MNNIFDPASGGAQGFIQYFLNFGSELAIFEDILISIIFPAVGLMISASAVWDFTKMRNPKHQSKVTGTSVAVRMMVGPTTILLIPFMTAMAESIFGDDNTGSSLPRAYRYANQASGGDPTQALILTILAFLVFVGWVTGLRAMIAFARVGNPQQDGFELFKTGFVRLAVATVLCMFQFFIDDMFESFTGEANRFSSELNL